MPREQRNEQRAREPDDVEVVPLDALDETTAETLDRIPPGPAFPLAAFEVGLEGLAAQGAKGHRRELVLDGHEVRTQQAEAGDHCVRPSPELPEHVLGIAPVGRLSVYPAVENDRRVDSERELTDTVNGARLSLGVAANELDRVVPRGIVLVVRR